MQRQKHMTQLNKIRHQSDDLLSNKWKMNFNVDKCSVLHIGHNIRTWQLQHIQSRVVYNRSTSRSSNLNQQDFKWMKQTGKNCKTASIVRGSIARNFKYKNKEMILPSKRVHCSFTCRIYAVQFWSTHFRQDIDRINRNGTATSNEDDSTIRNNSYSQLTVQRPETNQHYTSKNEKTIIIH